MPAAPRKHHVVPRWLLRQFLGADRRLHVLDVRRRRVDPSARSVDGVGWIPHFYSTGAPGARDASIEAWLQQFDGVGLSFLADVRAGRLAEPEHRLDAARMVMQLRLRTLRGLQLVRATWPDDHAPTEDELRQAFVGVMEVSTTDEPPLIAGQTWTLVQAPPGRSFVLSDCPVTSRLGDPPLGPRSHPELSLPISPHECLLVTRGEAGIQPSRALGANHYEEIVVRSALAADRWVWAHDPEVLTRLLRLLERDEEGSYYEEIGGWPGTSRRRA